MTSLLIREIPVPIETRKDADPQKVWVTGSSLANADIVRALLRFGRFDRCYFLWPSAGTPEVARRRLDEYAPDERASLIGVNDVAAIGARERLMLVTASSFVERLVPLRQVHERAAWPVTGFTHALSYRESLPQSLLMLLGDLYEYDSLVCTSEAGKRALQNVFGQLSEHLARRLGEVRAFRGRLPVIPLGSDVSGVPPQDRRACRERLGIPADALVFLCLGRFSPGEKTDPYPLILHFAEIARECGDVVLVFAGDDTQHKLAPKLEAFAASVGAGERVIIRPNLTRDEKSSFYGAADVFVSLSDSVQETFGLTLVEAMAHGLPVIASDWSGYRELVEHGRTGFLTATWWDAATVDPITCLLNGEVMAHWLLAQSVCVDWREVRQYVVALRDNADLRRQMGENARRRALARYDWPVVIRQYEDLWEEQLDAAASDWASSDAAASANAASNRAVSNRAASNGGARASAGHGLHRFDRRSIFSHYPTETANGVTLLRLTALGRRLIAGETPLATMSGARVFDGALGEAMAAINDSAIAPDGATSTMKALHAHLRRGLAASDEEIARGLVQLVKYGVLERVAAAQAGAAPAGATPADALPS